MGKFYGHSHLIALRAAEGYLCYHWLFGPYSSVVLFTDAKAAKEWLKKLEEFPDWELKLLPTMVSSHPAGFRATINPSSDFNDVARIMSRRFYENW